MKNQLVLITDGTPAEHHQPARTRGGASADRGTNGRPAGRVRTKPAHHDPARPNAERAHRGASAARRALQQAVQRATAREEARREAREAALLAAVTQPHLPHIGGTPDHRAA